MAQLFSCFQKIMPQRCRAFSTDLVKVARPKPGCCQQALRVAKSGLIISKGHINDPKCPLRLVCNLKPLQILNLLQMILQSSRQRVIGPSPEELHQLQTINRFKIDKRERVADKTLNLPNTSIISSIIDLGLDVKKC
jgi:hypothetical protein